MDRHRYNLHGDFLAWMRSFYREAQASLLESEARQLWLISHPQQEARARRHPELGEWDGLFPTGLN